MTSRKKYYPATLVSPSPNQPWNEPSKQPITKSGTFRSSPPTRPNHVPPSPVMTKANYQISAIHYGTSSKTNRKSRSAPVVTEWKSQSRKPKLSSSLSTALKSLAESDNATYPNHKTQPRHLSTQWPMKTPLLGEVNTFAI